MLNNNSTNRALVNSTFEIYSLLKKIQKSKQLISISFESLPQHCLTSLLEVQLNEKILVFDEPNPTLSTKLITIKNEAEFSLKLENLPIIFRTKLAPNKSRKKDNELTVLFPVEMYYPQNRHYYRFRTEFINNINTTIFLSSTKRLPAHLLDISLNGLCLRFPYSFTSMFQINQLIDDIYIELPQHNGFSISAKVQNIRIENNYSNFVLGLQIDQQIPIIEKTIQQFIFRAEKV